MPETHYKVPKKLVMTMMGFLIIAVISLVVYFEKKQDEGIKVNSQSVQKTMQQMMKQDKAIGIIAKDVENHKDNQSVHAE